MGGGDLIPVWARAAHEEVDGGSVSSGTNLPPPGETPAGVPVSSRPTAPLPAGCERCSEDAVVPAAAGGRGGVRGGGGGAGGGHSRESGEG